MTTPTFHQHLTAWKRAVTGQDHQPIPPEIVAATEEEYNSWVRELADAKIAANRAGYACAFNRSGKGKRRAAWIYSNGHTIKIVWIDKGTRQQAVTETSRQAFHDPEYTAVRATQKETVASFILWKQNTGGTVCRNHIWEYWQDRIAADSPLAQMSNVSRAVNDIIRNGATVQGVAYRLEIRETKTHGAGNTPVEHFRLVKVEHTADAVQMDLFNV